MASVNVNAITMRKLDEFDVQVLDAGGKTLAYINISSDKNGDVTITYAKGIGKVNVEEVKGE